MKSNDSNLIQVMRNQRQVINYWNTLFTIIIFCVAYNVRQAQQKHPMSIEAWTPKEGIDSWQEDAASNWERWPEGNLDGVARESIA